MYKEQLGKNFPTKNSPTSRSFQLHACQINGNLTFCENGWIKFCSSAHISPTVNTHNNWSSLSSTYQSCAPISSTSSKAIITSTYLNPKCSTNQKPENINTWVAGSTLGCSRGRPKSSQFWYWAAHQLGWRTCIYATLRLPSFQAFKFFLDDD